MPANPIIKKRIQIQYEDSDEEEIKEDDSEEEVKEGDSDQSQRNI